MEGRILGNRYELIEKIGGGGMAHVYKAKCRLLNRFVAIKTLRTEFTNDEEFVKRFIMEAQSAASLSHPNIVPIYDVGHEDNIHYIVMEYVDGITLKEYLTQKGVIKWREAVNIAIQICSAIEQAHRNHIVHRDIKPHNILLTRDGIAKVTDFGIARAVSSSTITMAGSTIGSVHYFSPEQARGGYVDEKSDIYSLGIALYEMVTGKLPFDGETPVAVALKHIQVEPQQPIELDYNIPKGVNTIIMKAIRKDQTKRFQSATEMLGDLYMVLKQPEGGFVEEETPEDFPTRRVQAISEENLNKEGTYAVKSETKPKKGDKLTVTLAVVTSLVIIALFGFLTYKMLFGGEVPGGVLGQSKPKEYVVTNFVGRSVEDVKRELKEAGFENIIENPQEDDKTPKGMVIKQNPEQGKKLKAGTYLPIELTVSAGPKLVEIPDFSKKDYRTAEKELTDLGLNYKIEEEFHETVVTGLVTRTEPSAGKKVKPESTVVIYKSKGPELKLVKVPNLIGKTRSEALKLLSDSKLKLGKELPEGGKNFVDKIIKQEPAADMEVKEEDAVSITFESVAEQKQTRYEARIINLLEPGRYGDKIRVYVEVKTPSTNKTEIIVNTSKNKTDFPLTIAIPVSDKEKTMVRIFLDDMTRPYAEFPIDASGGQ